MAGLFSEAGAESICSLCRSVQRRNLILRRFLKTSQNVKTTATLDPDGTTFTMARGAWANSYPLTDLPKWIAFYRRQAKLHPGQSSYADDIEALEGLKRQVDNRRANGQEVRRDEGAPYSPRFSDGLPET